MLKLSLKELFDTLPQQGKVEWIGLRPQRRATMETPSFAIAESNQGLVGDRYAGRSGKRAVTLIQHEHLPVIASILGLTDCNPELLRRNISVSGINLLSIKGKQFIVGDAILEYTGLCHPCSFLEKTFGAGGYNAVRGHGGITARVIKRGQFQLNSVVSAVRQELKQGID